MAIFTLNNPSVLDALVGNSVTLVQSSTRWVESFPSTGAGLEILGSFAVSGGSIIGGSISAINYTQNGAVLLTVTGLNFTLQQFITASANGSTAVATLLYGGADQFFGSNFAEVLTAHGGADTVIAMGGNDIVYGGAGNDDVNGNLGEDIVHGDEGQDTVRGGQGDDTVYGDDGDDGHVNGNIGNDIVRGGAGADTVYGGQGADTLYGDAGSDLLSGDLGNDYLYGGEGADRFAIRAGGGTDIALDFKAVEGDRVQLTPGTAYTTGAFIDGSLMITAATGEQLVLLGITSASFSADWIVFA